MADPLSVIGALAACCDLGLLLVNVVKSYAKANEDITNLADRLQYDVVLLNEFLGFFRTNKDYFRARNEDGHLDRIVDNLRVILQKTARRTEKLGKSGPLDRIRWLAIKPDLIAAEDAIYHWSQRFTARLATLPDAMKQELIDSVQRDGKANRSVMTGLAALLKMKTAAAAQRDEASLLRLEKPEPLSIAVGNQKYHIEPLNVPLSAQEDPDRLKEIKIEVAKLADTLQGAGPSQIHILEAYGFFETGTRETPFAMAYILPDGVQAPTNLLNVLEQKPSHTFEQPLEARLHLAVSITTAVAYLHAMSFVHKSIRSSNILLTYPLLDPLSSDTTPAEPTFSPTFSTSQASQVTQPATPYHSQIGTPYLVGFSYARRGTARSTGSSRAEWRNEIYRHPERQAAELGIDIEVAYRSYHDVYSVGVVLLELGLWERLDGGAGATPGATQLMKRAAPHQRRERLLALARMELPAKMGSTFAGIVKRCLEVDGDKESEGRVEEQITIQNVLEELDEIHF